MLASQFVLSAITIFIIYKTLISYKKQELSKPFTLLWIICWLSILVLIFYPNFLSSIAHILGIGRGVDLAIYLSVIVIFYLLYKIFVKLNETEKRITQIIREIALKNSQIPSKKQKQ